MTIDEIYEKLIQHMTKGLMFHEKLADYYDFLGLKGYKRCHEYRFFEETIKFRKVVKYYINHYSKLPSETLIDSPKVIPANWYSHIREDVDIQTKRNSVKTGIQLWKDWEIETKKLYEQLFKELCELNDVSSSNMLSCLICDVDKELKYVQRKWLELKAIDYDMKIIIPCQQEIHDKYKKKMKELDLDVECW